MYDLIYRADNQIFKINEKIISIQKSNQLGYFSKSKWKTLGRIVPESTVADGIVVTESGRIMISSLNKNDIIVKKISDKIVLIATKYYYVFKNPEQNPEQKNTVININSIQKKEEEGEGRLHNDVKNQNHLGQEHSLSHPKITVYSPQNLDLEDDIHRDEILHFVDTIIRKKIHNNLGRDDYVPLKMTYLRANYKNIKEWLPKIMGKIIERDNYYEPRIKSYGYRLTKKYRYQEWKTRTLSSKTFFRRKMSDIAKATRSKAGSYIWDNLHKGFVVDIDQFTKQYSTHESFKNHLHSAKRINDGDLFITECDFGERLHTNVTNLSKALRPFIRVNGESLVEIDLVSSQPMFLAVLMRKHKKDVTYYQSIIESETTDIYKFLGEKSGMSREEAKDELLRILYSKNGYRSRAKTIFEHEFPHVAEFINDCKRTDHKRLSSMLQKTESMIVLHRIVEMFRVRSGEAFITTIHDAFMVKKEHLNLLTNCIDTIFSELQVKAKYRITEFDSQQRSNKLDFPKYII